MFVDADWRGELRRNPIRKPLVSPSMIYLENALSGWDCRTVAHLSARRGELISVSCCGTGLAAERQLSRQRRSAVYSYRVSQSVGMD